ncbi:N-acetylmuramoyl-L-alanine amidase family protein [Fictibacillus sp. JL2B1089]|uniref:peptidoglycan recognition protein family protein n=1 Tax=Fictibacillus sp. JL2B1089 TaxID=3399565 RepID=UPI003A84BDFC
MKYQIKKDYIKVKTNRRPGILIKPEFGVLHDTGNYGSTAQNNVDYFKNTPMDSTSASAHTFIDDIDIIECVPLTLDKAERAHHVRYNVPADNHLFGDDANDIAAGVELCFGEHKKTGRVINFKEAYKRYVWYCAYVSYVFKFNPNRWIGHEKLDPGRKTDPSNALKRYGKTYEQLLKDIVDEYNECTKAPVSEQPKPKSNEPKLKTSSDGVYWDGVKMVKGQIGRLHILKDINLYDANKKFIKVLPKSCIFRVYGVNEGNNYKYEVGGGCTVSNVSGYVQFNKADDDLIAANEQIYK